MFTLAYMTCTPKDPQPVKHELHYTEFWRVALEGQRCYLGGTPFYILDANGKVLRKGNLDILAQWREASTTAEKARASA